MDIWYQWCRYLKVERCLKDPKKAVLIKTISVCRSDDCGGNGIQLNLGQSFVQDFVPYSAVMEIESVWVGKPLGGIL